MSDPEGFKALINGIDDDGMEQIKEHNEANQQSSLEKYHEANRKIGNNLISNSTELADDLIAKHPYASTLYCYALATAPLMEVEPPAAFGAGLGISVADAKGKVKETMLKSQIVYEGSQMNRYSSLSLGLTIMWDKITNYEVSGTGDISEELFNSSQENKVQPGRGFGD